MALGQGAKHPCSTEVSKDLGHFSDWITHYLEISHPQHTLQSRATSTAEKVTIKSVPKGATPAKMPQRMAHVKTLLMASLQTRTEAKMKSGKSQCMYA